MVFVSTWDCAKVREILELTSITKVPQTPDFMRGVINLRGSVVPVIDLRLNFGMQCTEQTVNTCIIVVEVNLKGETIVLGVLADSVQELLEFWQDKIDPPLWILVFFEADPVFLDTELGQDDGPGRARK